MIITLTIAPAVETVGIQTIAVALGLNSVTDEQARVALGTHLRTVVANLYLRGDDMKRKAAAEAPAQTALQFITSS